MGIKNIFSKEYFFIFIIFLAGLVFYCYEFFLRIIPGAYSLEIIEFLKLETNTHFTFSLLISSYNISYLAMQIPAGMLLDKFGSKKILPLAILICGIGNFVFIYNDFYISLLGRILVGCGSAFGFIGVLKITRDRISTKYFPTFVAIVISLGTLAGSYAQQISTIIAEKFVWQFVFSLSGTFAIPLALFTYMVLSSKGNKQTIKNTDNREVFKQVFILLKNKNIFINAFIGGMLYAPTVVLSTQWGVYFFTNSYLLDKATSTKAITFLMFGWVISSPLIGIISDKIGNTKKILTILSLFSFGILFLIMYKIAFSTNYILELMFILGIFSASQILIWHFFNQECPKKFSGVGIALTNMIIIFWVEVIQLGIGGLMDLDSIIKNFAKISGYNSPLQFATIFIFIAMFFALFLLRKLNKGHL